MSFARQTEGYFPDFDIDLDFSENEEAALVELLNAIAGGRQTMEVKAERKALRTGNVFIEFAQTPQGQPEKPSGIQTTKADWYAIVIGPTRILVPSDYLRYAARKYGRDHPKSVKPGGLDGDNPTRGVAIPLNDLVRLVWACRPFDS